MALGRGSVSASRVGVTSWVSSLGLSSPACKMGTITATAAEGVCEAREKQRQVVQASSQTAHGHVLLPRSCHGRRPSSPYEVAVWLRGGSEHWSNLTAPESLGDFSKVRLSLTGSLGGLEFLHFS